ncbi:MAG: hypothetical protein FD152_3975 [Xanthobacteraceae bacterium]|nr:MAG: hypothetical protein FD152_3975 [Xanthobacteraceae bacterium]
MRQLRLAIALLFALTLSAQGLLGHASMAQRLAEVSAAEGLCIPSPGEGDRLPGHICISHCLAVAGPTAAPPPELATPPVPGQAFVAKLRPAPTELRLVHVLPRDHAPRAPPARA